MRAERCAWPRCRSAEIELTYLGRQLCRKHWDRLCEMQDEGRGADARELLGLAGTGQPRGSSGPQRNSRPLEDSHASTICREHPRRSDPRGNR
jgi:hypothetical protein